MYNFTGKFDFLIRCLTFVKNKTNQQIDGQTSSETHSTIERLITTATKIERKLVVTMISPWQAPLIMNNLATIPTYPARGDGLLIGNHKNKFEL